VRLAAAAALAAIAAAEPAAAMQLEKAPLPGTPNVALLAQGRIEPGDAAALRALLHKLPPGQRVASVVLNSPGGAVAEARVMARILNTATVPVVVPHDAVCASACFILFAAARHKVVEPGAMIGVHSASVSGGRETGDTLGVTTLMAREVAAYGVPAEITGRMVTTQPGQMAWLSRDELELMGAKVEAGADAPLGASQPGSAAGKPSDWSAGFEQGRRATSDAACAPPAGVADREDFSLGCASGRRSGGAQVAASTAPRGPAHPPQSDWSRGFDYGRAQGNRAQCVTPPDEVANPADWSLGCNSGRRS
jgi:hypothetical protein